MNIDDYVADERYTRSGDTNWLIHKEYGEIQPNPKLTRDTEKALAEIAAVIHKNAPILEAEQLEQGVRWLKSWRYRVNPERAQRRDIYEYHSLLDKIRDSPAQVKLQNKALIQLVIAGLFTSAALVMFVVQCIAHWYSDGAAWYWQVLNILVFIGFYSGARTFMIKGLMTAKEQDRRYVMASIRAATTAMEINASGLFAYLPGTVWEAGQQGDSERAHESMCIARERLTDALYRDPEDYLGAYSSLLTK